MSMANNSNQGASYESNINLDEFTKCYICLCKIQDASMCPNCQKISCQRCIQILDNISYSKKQYKNELCKEHNITILYFCVKCNESLCSDCYMFGNRHKDHEISKLDQVYGTHVELIKNESKEIQKKFELLNSFLKSLNDKIISVGSYKLEKSNELEELFDNLKNKLENKVHMKLTKLMACKNEISEKLKFLENVKCNLDKELTESAKSLLISKSEDLIKNLKNLNFDSESLETKFSDNVNMNISSEIPSEILPQYESSFFEISDYKKLICQIQINSSSKETVEDNNNINSQYKISKEKEFIYSNELVTNGLVWRIKVYPFGNSGAKGEYISIFLELIEGLSETSKYYYKIELCNFFYVNGDKRFSNHSREFSSDFSNGECWGYNRFYKIENLEREGYIDNATGKLKIKFYVRPQTYSQLCRDQKNYIATVEKRLKYYTNSAGSINRKNLNLGNNNLLQNEEMIKNKNEIIILKERDLLLSELKDEKKVIQDQEIDLNNLIKSDFKSDGPIPIVNNQEGNLIEQEKVDPENSENIICIPNNQPKIIYQVDEASSFEINIRNNKPVSGLEKEFTVKPEFHEITNLIDANKEDEQEEGVIITEINNRNTNINLATTNNNKNVENEMKLFLESNNNNIRNFNLDMYDPDLSFNNSIKEILQGNFIPDNNKYTISNKKNDSGSEDGSSFGSLMDSIKLIEESSFQEKNLKNLRRVEKEKDLDFFCASAQNANKNINMEANSNKKYQFNYANSNSGAGYIKNFKSKLDKDLRSSTDKFDDLIYNLYPENSFKFQKTSYKKFINGGQVSHSSKATPNNSQHKPNLNNLNNSNNNELGLSNNDIASMNDEKLKNLISKKKSR